MCSGVIHSMHNITNIDVLKKGRNAQNIKNAKYTQCVSTLLSIMVIQATNKVSGIQSVTGNNGKSDGIAMGIEPTNQETKTKTELDLHIIRAECNLNLSYV